MKLSEIIAFVAFAFIVSLVAAVPAGFAINDYWLVFCLVLTVVLTLIFSGIFLLASYYRHKDIEREQRRT